MSRVALALILVVMGSAPAAAISEETIGMIVMEAMAPSVSDDNMTGRAFLDTLEKIRHGGKVEMPDSSCATNQCVGVFMAIETVRTARARAHAEWRRKAR